MVRRSNNPADLFRQLSHGVRFRFLSLKLSVKYVLFLSGVRVVNHRAADMNEFLRDMLAVTAGVIVGGLVLMAVYDYYYNVHLLSTAVGG